MDEDLQVVGDKLIVATRCICLGFEEDAVWYVFPGVYMYRERPNNGNIVKQLFVDGRWRGFLPGEEEAFTDVVHGRDLHDIVSPNA